MFTGIVQAMGSIRAVERRDFGVRFVVENALNSSRLGDFSPPASTAPGQSVSVSGVCLTVVESDPQTLAFDVIPQTLSATTLGSLRPGDKVNLEPSLVVGQAMGGHFVQGHVDGVATVTKLTVGDGGHRITFTTDAHLFPYIVSRGSITLDGVSMTLAEVSDRDFTVAVIPTTLAITTLGLLKQGGRANVETDILARTIVRRMQMQLDGEPAVNLELLRAAGFAS